MLRWCPAANAWPNIYEILDLICIGLRWSRAIGLVGFADDWVLSYSIQKNSWLALTLSKFVVGLSFGRKTSCSAVQTHLLVVPHLDQIRIRSACITFSTIGEKIMCSGAPSEQVFLAGSSPRIHSCWLDRGVT